MGAGREGAGLPADQAAADDVREGVERGGGGGGTGGSIGHLILATETELSRCWRMVGAAETLGCLDPAQAAEVADITRRFGELLAAGGLGR